MTRITVVILAILASLAVWRWLLRKTMTRPRRVIYEAPFTLLEDPYLEVIWPVEKDCGS